MGDLPHAPCGSGPGLDNDFVSLQTEVCVHFDTRLSTTLPVVLTKGKSGQSLSRQSSQAVFPPRAIFSFGREGSGFCYGSGRAGHYNGCLDTVSGSLLVVDWVERTLNDSEAGVPALFLADGQGK